MTKPSGKPPIDRSAPEAEIPPAAAAAPPAPAAPAAAQDTPMPAAENEPASIFQPGPGIGTADVFEITLMYLLSMTNSPVQVAPGELRSIALEAVRVGQLSESARRFMQPLGQPAATN